MCIYGTLQQDVTHNGIVNSHGITNITIFDISSLQTAYMRELIKYINKKNLIQRKYHNKVLGDLETVLFFILTNDVSMQTC